MGQTFQTNGKTLTDGSFLLVDKKCILGRDHKPFKISFESVAYN